MSDDTAASPALADAQFWVSDDGQDKRSILWAAYQGRDEVVYGDHADGEEHSCTAVQFRKWITRYGARLVEGEGV